LAPVDDIEKSFDALFRAAIVRLSEDGAPQYNQVVIVARL
jgi:hypothetical protein